MQRSETEAVIDEGYPAHAMKSDLALIDVATGNVKRLVTGLNIVAFDLAPDERSVAFIALLDGFGRFGYSRAPRGLFVVPVSGGRVAPKSKGLVWRGHLPGLRTAGGSPS